MLKWKYIALHLMLLHCTIMAAAQHEEYIKIPVVVTNNSAPVTQIDTNMAGQIFLKQMRTWPNGEHIQPIDIKEGSLIRKDFYYKIVKRSPAQLRAYWARQIFTGMGTPPKQVSSIDEVNNIVRNNQSAVGYVGITDIDKEVKIILNLNQ